MTDNSAFADRLLDWWADHGRHDLPWQQNRTPYRTWVAEVMLQQTQVATVIPYFERFMATFPDLETLAGAELDAVLAAWTGLGYYARARNLHAAARQCVDQFGGRLPTAAGKLATLPGIGRSTANAIAAQAHGHPVPILDGNARRVLARHAGVAGWPGRSAVERRLWSEAQARVPKRRAGDYTQAIMDLGAGICTPRRPDCRRCPVAAECSARISGRTARLPTPGPKRVQPRRSTTLLLLENDRGQILFERRPPAGIWGGLWSLPEADHPGELPTGTRVKAPAAIRHRLTHFTLEIAFERRRIDAGQPIADGDNRRWMRPEQALECGLPQPVRKLIERLD